MKRHIYALSFVFLVVLLPQLNAAAYQEPKPATTATGVTGTYKYVLNKLEVLELPDHKVRISFAGYYPNDRRKVETRNVGAFDETVPLKGHTATVKIQFGDEPCLVTISFRANKAIVEQGGSLMGCGFGFNVEPDGTYTKVSSKPPDLPPVQK